MQINRNKSNIYLRKINSLFIIKRQLIFFILFLVIGNADASRQESGLWAGLSSSRLFNQESRWLYLFSTQQRFNFQNPATNTLNIRAGLGYQIAPRWQILSGYHIFITTNQPNQWKVRQQRIWQQLNWIIKPTNQGFVNSSARLEQRFRNNDKQFAWRMRAKIQWFTFKPNRGKTTPYIANEVLINLNQTSLTTPYVFNQNRFFIGISIPISEKERIIISYLNLFELDKPQNIVRHILLLNYIF